MNYVTKLWAGNILEMGVYKPMLLLKRNGPLLIGLSLQKNRGNDQYEPNIHLHNLCFESDGISLSAPMYLLTDRSVPYCIRGDKDGADILQYASKLKKQFPITCMTNVPFKQVVSYIFGYISTKNEWTRLPDHGVFLDLASWAKILGKDDLAEDIILYPRNNIPNWTELYLENFEDPDDWEKWTRNMISNRDSLLNTVESQINTLKLASIPSYDLTINEEDTITFNKWFQK